MSRRRPRRGDRASSAAGRCHQAIDECIAAPVNASGRPNYNGSRAGEHGNGDAMWILIGLLVWFVGSVLVWLVFAVVHLSDELAELREHFDTVLCAVDAVAPGARVCDNAPSQQSS